MAYLGITACDAELAVAGAGGSVRDALTEKLAGVPATEPVVILVHGYKFHPGFPDTDPHRSLYALPAARSCRKVRSWPQGLGFAADAGATGLCIGFAWPADEPHLTNLIARGRTGFAAVYDRAEAYAARLAALVREVQALAPGRPVDLLAHSLGARVALAALPHLEETPGRVLLLGAAEFDARACDILGRLRMARLPQVYNVTARANDLYDLIFETFAPRGAPGARGDRALGLGLGPGRAVAHWIDMQLDRAEVTDWINRRGIALSPSKARPCHWGFYTRPGAFAVYEAILRRRPGWDVGSLRAARCFGPQDPRWSRLLPRAPMGFLASRPGGGIGPDLSSA